MGQFEKPVIVDFPLRGEWLAPHTPGTRVPSHGSDQFGQSYAFDFLQVDWERKGTPFYQTGPLRYLLLGVPLKRCYGWGQAIYAPCDGKVIHTADGYRERPIVYLASDLGVLLKNALFFDPAKCNLQDALGNYLIIECQNNVFALFAHLQTNSIAVATGQSVQRGQILGRVGHSGNSTAPHLHFQLMDSSDLALAKGIACVFREYDLFQDGQWKTVHESVPADTDRIRFNG